MRTVAVAATTAVLAGVLAVSGFQAAAPAKAKAPAASKTSTDDALIAGFKKSTVASVSDAVDQITGERGFLSHDMQPRVPGQVVGRAVTALLRQTSPDKATAALSAKHSVAMIDNAKPGEVGVIVVENGLDVAGMGGLMATTAKVRGMAGVLIDGGLRDVAEVRALGLPAYSRSVVPSSSVGRWASVDNNIPVRCAGVTIRPGDIIVAGEDGAVRVPQERAAEILKRSQEIDERETKMVPLIKQYKALSRVVEVFNRI
jgi:4-hydroxy-4-methyl-2-oxoglutarate aldolase